VVRFASCCALFCPDSAALLGAYRNWGFGGFNFNFWNNDDREKEEKKQEEEREENIAKCAPRCCVCVPPFVAQCAAVVRSIKTGTIEDTKNLLKLERTLFDDEIVKKYASLAHSLSRCRLGADLSACALQGSRSRAGAAGPAAPPHR
jgi:hypothetical protein